MKTSVLKFGMEHKGFLAACCRKWEKYKADRIERKFLKENPEICQEIEAKVRSYYHLDGEEAAEGAGADASVETAASVDAVASVAFVVSVFLFPQPAKATAIMQSTRTLLTNFFI